MKKWYQGIVVEHKEISNKMYHCFDDENFKTLIEERNEQLKEIERLHSIIKEAKDYIEEYWKSQHYYEDVDNCMTFCEYDKEVLLEILDKVGDEK